jgi:hypothetical protein
MGTAYVLDRAQDSELDFHAVGLLTQVGALSDDVVGDLIRVEAGLIRGSASTAIRAAAALFAAAAQTQSTARGLWDPEGLSDTLRLVAGVAEPQLGAAPSPDGQQWAAAVASDLELVLADEADSTVIHRLEQQFSGISAATFNASADALRYQRGFAFSWLRY